MLKLLLVLMLLPVAALPMAWRVEREAGSGSGPGERSCTVVSLGGELRARLAEGEGGGTAVWTVRLGVDNQPGSLRYLRVGKRIFQTDKARFDGAKAAEIVARLKLPEVFVLEWAAGPGGAKRGGLYQTGNFAERAETCETWMSGRRI
jgi:hypothetical protein